MEHHFVLTDPGAELLDEAGTPQGPRFINSVVVRDRKGGSRVAKGGISQGEPLLGRDKGGRGGGGGNGARRGGRGCSGTAFPEHSWRWGGLWRVSASGAGGNRRGGGRRLFGRDAPKVDGGPGCGFVQVQDEALSAMFDEGAEWGGLEGFFKYFLKGIVSIAVELAFAASHGFKLLLEALEMSEGDSKSGVPPVHKCPSTGVRWMVEGDFDVDVGVALSGDVGDNHLLGRATLLFE